MAETPELRDRDFELLAELIHRASGVRLGPEKRDLLATRLRPVLEQLQVPSWSRLAHVARTDRTGEKLALLVDRATTNTTGFFRHGQHFDLLRASLPELARGGRIRVWSAGCSTGEEPYSIALVLLASSKVKDARVLATDVSRRALARAVEGVYDEDAVASVPPPLRHHLERVGEGAWRIDAATRAAVTFRVHDLRDAGAARDVFDAIFCRNVLIYFDESARAAATARLERLLRPGGILFLGPSEASVLLPSSFARLGPAAYKKS